MFFFVGNAQLFPVGLPPDMTHWAEQKWKQIVPTNDVEAGIPNTPLPQRGSCIL